MDYDLLVIGSGPAGLHAAVQAAKAGKHVAIVERTDLLGGVEVNTGTIPSKTLREAVLYLSGYRERGYYGDGYRIKAEITIEDLLSRCREVMQHEREIVLRAILNNHVELIYGHASFAAPHQIAIAGPPAGSVRQVSAEFVVIAAGTRPARPLEIPFDDQQILDSDDILKLDRIPRSLAVVGAGVIGCEYASMFAALGAHVNLIDRHPSILTFVDSEIVETLTSHLRDTTELVFHFSEAVAGIEQADGLVHVTLGSGKRIVAERVLYCAGRIAATDSLNLESIGLTADAQGHLPVDANYQTVAAGVYAAGDVIGFPSLASTSAEQGRVAACHAFGIPVTSVPAHFPFGIYTIPEISMVGATEQELTAQKIPYEVGRAHYREIARAQIIGDVNGLLKLLFHCETREILGVHIIGEGATELVHIGQAAIALQATLDYFLNTVFNYPTLAEGYKIAALNGYNRMTSG